MRTRSARTMKTSDFSCRNFLPAQFSWLILCPFQFVFYTASRVVSLKGPYDPPLPPNSPRVFNDSRIIEIKFKPLCFRFKPCHGRFLSNHILPFLYPPLQAILQRDKFPLCLRLVTRFSLCNAPLVPTIGHPSPSPHYFFSLFL